MNFNCKLKIENVEFNLIRQNFNSNKIINIREEVTSQLDSIKAFENIGEQKRIGITAGSRGINNIIEITKSIVDYIKSYGGDPFIIPSMGSHGSANAEGQLHVLTELGITEETMECPIISSVEVVKIGELENGAPVYFDKIAHEADGIVVVNRIKPHTDFEAKIESGLVKMVAVGLGNQMGCSTMHSYGLSKCIPMSFRVSKEKENLLFGLGIVENSKDETYKLVALRPDEFEDAEHDLLNESKNLIPKLPIDNLDLLVVEEMGKMYSGTGMDTKVIGRIKIKGEQEPTTPDIKKVVVLDLASNSYGNALGIGLADLTTRKLVDKINYTATYENIISTTYLERGKIPVNLANDKEAIEVGMNTVGDLQYEDIKICIIKNTLHLQELYLSNAALANVDLNKIEVLKTKVKLEFDELGNIKFRE